jgi:hypothetical protein
MQNIFAASMNTSSILFEFSKERTLYVRMNGAEILGLSMRPLSVLQ